MQEVAIDVAHPAILTQTHQATGVGGVLLRADAVDRLSFEVRPFIPEERQTGAVDPPDPTFGIDDDQRSGHGLYHLVEVTHGDRRATEVGTHPIEGFPQLLELVTALEIDPGGEITASELRETLTMIAQYAGYPRAAALVGVIENAIAEVEKEKGGAS